MGDFIERTAREWRERAREEASDRETDQQLRGFTRAAGIMQRRIEARLDAMKTQMTEGPALTKSEQAIFMALNELRTEIEAEYDSYWSTATTGLDWRPPPPIARRQGQTSTDD